MLEHADALTAEEKRDLQAAQAFWHEENTARKLDIAFAKRYGYIPPKGYQGPGAGNCDCRVAGTNVDFEKLIALGFDGLDREIDAAAEKNGASSFYDALKLWIESLRGACARYREQALALSETAESEPARRRFAALHEISAHHTDDGSLRFGPHVPEQRGMSVMQRIKFTNYAGNPVFCDHFA